MAAIDSSDPLLERLDRIIADFYASQKDFYRRLEVEKRRS